ncbi:MAG: YdcF family protein, partial [Minicystis sp.]
STTTGAGGQGGAGTTTGGGGSAGMGGSGEGGAGGGGDVNASALCSMPAMTDLFSGPFPPNPYAAAIPADACVSSGHDVIVLLGCPNNDDGTPSACQTKRVEMGIALRDAGWGGRFITSGAAVHNAFVEAETLRQLLLAEGVADADIFVDPLAQHTDENLYYSTKIMETQGWESALVVSDDPGHLVMTALCDSNCCVDLGRLTVVSLPVAGGSVVTGHYARYPWGEAVVTAECDVLKQPLKFMCVNLASRKACKDNFQL